MTTNEVILQGKARPRDQASADEREFLVYYDEFFARVYTYIRYRCSDRSAADDLTAIVFEKALARFDRYSPQRGAFNAWIFAIARNEVNAHLRAQMRATNLPIEQADDHPGDTPSPEQAMIAGETQRELMAALDSLGNRERDLIGLKFSARFTNRQIAALTGLSESNVGVILYRALQKLRLKLRTIENEA